MYPLNYKKELKKSEIALAIKTGAIWAIFSQFIADIIVHFLDNNEKSFKIDLEIRNITFYYASVGSGIVAAILSLYMDRFATVFFSSLAYSFIFELSNELIYKDPFEINSFDVIMDIGITIILVYAFDDTSKNDYLNHFYERHFMLHEKLKGDRNLFQIIFFTILASTYSYLKEKNRTAS